MFVRKGIIGNDMGMYGVNYVEYFVVVSVSWFVDVVKFEGFWGIFIVLV